MKLISCLAMATSLSSLLSHEASALDIYAVKSTSQKIASISDADFAKNPTVYNTVDPNFSGMKAADYSGVSIEKIATLAKLSGDDVVTFLCKDNYIMSETLTTLLATNALVANKLGGVDILPKSGGPITMVHNKTTTNDLYPWYITSIVVGSVDHPSLHLSMNSASGNDLSWDQISKSKEQSSSAKIFPAPRGRRPKADSSSEISRKITFVPLSSLSKASGKTAGKTSKKDAKKDSPALGSTVNYTLIDGQITSKKYSAEEFKSLTVVTMIDGKSIQVRQGGPFVVTSSLAKASELPIFYVSAIDILEPK